MTDPEIELELIMTALITAIAQTHPELLAKTDHNFRLTLDSKRKQLRDQQESPHTLRTFESNVDELLRQLVLLR